MHILLSNSSVSVNQQHVRLLIPCHETSKSPKLPAQHRDYKPFVAREGLDKKSKRVYQHLYSWLILNCDYTGKIRTISLVRYNSLKFDIHFLGLPWEIFFGVTTDGLLHLKSLKNVKKNAIFFKLFKIFVHWISKLLNVLVDSVFYTTTWEISAIWLS